MGEGLEAIVVCQAKVEHADALYALLSQTDTANILFSMMQRRRMFLMASSTDQIGYT